MSPHSTSAPLYNGPPLDDHNRTFLEWKPLSISQADVHEFTQFYMNKAYVPSDLERSILSILDDDVQVDKLKQPELYHVEDGLAVRHKKVKYHDGDCLDILLADVRSIASQYRTAMIPSSLVITAAEYDAFLWANHYMVKLSEVFLDDKQIWDLIRVISSNAKASGQPCSVAAIDATIKDALATRHLRSLAQPTPLPPDRICSMPPSLMLLPVPLAHLADVVVAPRRSAILLAVVVATAVEITAIALGAMKAIESVAAEAFHRHHTLVGHVVLKLRSTPLAIPTVLMFRHRLPSRSVSFRPTPVIVLMPQVVCIVATVTLFRLLISVLPLCPLAPWYLSIVLVICPVAAMLIVVLLLPVVTTLELAPATGRTIPCFMVDLVMWLRLLLLHLPALVVVWTEMTITDPRSVCAGLHHRRIPSVTPAPQIPFWTKLYLPPLFALKVMLTGHASSPENHDLPSSVIYPPGKFAALSEHWIVDSGATSSCIPYQDYFSSYVPCALSLTVGNGSKLPVVGYGSISMETLMSATDVTFPMRSRALRLKFGLHCPQLRFNLLSVAHAADDGYAIAFPSRVRPPTQWDCSPFMPFHMDV
ncbi:hypothetical protein H257_15018 [Aphanomyces astaci]|uniref:Retrovirus-related Pol polyprotein from transposon TNT 1-94-like beta-barrel domain-containing protein n=1 Tax=Aphanomyces astaci TaxID=112090 RepID=W4FQV9_APHAT|nr:hypothetical protein H257_15018 [Aphanomyces astaci]ETV69189.1 hypothetical protein H257_15018 [Aphanomyces astaci]|eukprot:XP_009841291.1 hypothetical protein H257_15018 [Aphanomyces astaci]